MPCVSAAHGSRSIGRYFFHWICALANAVIASQRPYSTNNSSDADAESKATEMTETTEVAEATEATEAIIEKSNSSEDAVETPEKELDFETTVSADAWEKARAKVPVDIQHAEPSTPREGKQRSEEEPTPRISEVKPKRKQPSTRPKKDEGPIPWTADAELLKDDELEAPLSERDLQPQKGIQFYETEDAYQQRIKEEKSMATTAGTAPIAPGKPVTLPQAFKNTLRQQTSNVTVLTARSSSGEPVGATISSMVSVTVEPKPLISFNLKRPSKTLDAILDGSKTFNVHTLDASEAGVDIAKEFVGWSAKTQMKQDPSWDEINWTGNENEAPMLLGEEIPSVFVCRVESSQTVADHDIVVAEVIDIKPDGGAAEVIDRKGGIFDGLLTFRRGSYRGPGQAFDHHEKVAHAMRWAEVQLLHAQRRLVAMRTLAARLEMEQAKETLEQHEQQWHLQKEWESSIIMKGDHFADWEMDIRADERRKVMEESTSDRWKPRKGVRGQPKKPFGEDSAAANTPWQPPRNSLTDKTSGRTGVDSLQELEQWNKRRRDVYNTSGPDPFGTQKALDSQAEIRARQADEAKERDIETWVITREKKKWDHERKMEQKRKREIEMKMFEEDEKRIQLRKNAAELTGSEATIGVFDEIEQKKFTDGNKGFADDGKPIVAPWVD